ncbi:MAG: thioesterase family protein [Bacteroidota bacterium]|nr:thioesterase family protein [Bacteroidota bacterium]
MEPAFPFSVPIQVRFNDVDIMGHVSNTVYQNYYDTGKTDYFDHILPDLDYVNIGVVGASIKIDYLLPIFMKYKITVKTRISILGTKSFTMEHWLINLETGELLSTCTAVLVCFDIKAGKSRVIPAHWRKAIMETEGDQLIIK